MSEPKGLRTYQSTINKSLPKEGKREIEEWTKDHLVLLCHSESRGITAINSFTYDLSPTHYGFVAQAITVPYMRWEDVGG